mgnify:CR=1 FL=1
MKGIHVGSIDNVATAIEPLQVGEEVLGVVIKRTDSKRSQICDGTNRQRQSRY